MFRDKYRNIEIILGAYRKLKSYYYYEKKLLYNKYKLSAWEESEEYMKIAVNNLADFMCSLYEEPDEEYLELLLNKVIIRILPKAFAPVNGNTKQVISNEKFLKFLDKVNYFIDAPVELMILDIIWVLSIGKIIHDKDIFDKTILGNILDTHLIFDDSCYDLINGIRYDNRNCFKPYFNEYRRWKDDAFNIMQSRYNEQKDSVFIKIDIKDYYYSVKFNFASLDKRLNDDRLELVKPIQNIIEKLFIKYTKEIDIYRNDIVAGCEQNECILPIGLLSSYLIGNLYLLDFDKDIQKYLNPLYYARYVDDIILVTKKTNTMSINIDSVLSETLVNEGILSIEDNETYRIKNIENLKIKKKKVKIIHINHTDSNAMIELLVSKAKIDASEYRLLPDVFESINTFYDSAYQLGSNLTNVKLDDLLFTNDKNNAARYLKNFIRVIKNINTKTHNTVIENRIDQIFRFYNGYEGIEFYEVWVDIFSIFVIMKKFEMAADFFKEIKKVISELQTDKIESIRNCKLDIVLKNIKETLYEEVKLSLAIALTLDLSDVTRLDLFFLLEEEDYRELIPVVESIREANMFNQHLTSYPLISFINTNTKEYSLLETDLNKIAEFTQSGKDGGKIFNERKLNLSPCFMHISDFSLCYFITQYRNGGNISDDTFKYLKGFFKKSNNINEMNLFWNENSPKSEEEKAAENKERFILQRIKTFTTNKVYDYPPKSIKVALASIWIDEKNYVLNTLKNSQIHLTLENKKKLYEMLNCAVEKEANIVVFPEFYLPFAWLQDVANFARENRVTIISGLQYIKADDRVYNYMATIQPFASEKNHKNSVVLFREKNNYAALEKIELAKVGLKCQDNETPSFRTITCNAVSWSEMLCYELTSIEYRTALLGKVELLIIPELNRDTQYFSNIVEATSRDLHCFVIQSNTSKYGDSRITGPYRTFYKNIIQVKGGQDDVLLIGDLDINELNLMRKSYKNDLEKRIENPSIKPPNNNMKAPPANFPDSTF